MIRGNQTLGVDVVIRVSRRVIILLAVALALSAGACSSSPTSKAAGSDRSTTSLSTLRTTTTTSAFGSIPSPGEAWPISLVPTVSRVATGPAQSNPDDLRFVDDLTGFAVIRGCPGCQPVLEETTDGGISWQRVPDPVEAVGAEASYQIRVGPEGQLWLFTVSPDDMQGGVVFRSLDDGRSWDQLTGFYRLADLAPEGRSVWALAQTCVSGGAFACQTTLVVSSDAGATWLVAPVQPSMASTGSAVSQPVLQLLRIDPYDAWVLSAADDPETPFLLSQTEDGGATWVSRIGPPRHCAGFPASLAAVDRSHLWFACGGNGATIMELREVATSANGGSTWQVTFDGMTSGHMQELAAASWDNAFLAECRNSVEASFNVGTTWAGVIPDGAPLDGCNSPVQFLDPEHGWAGGEDENGNTVVWRTVDGGHHWTEDRLP